MTFYVICINSIDNQPANLLHILSSELESNRKSKPWMNSSSDWKKGFSKICKARKREKKERKKERKFNLVSRVYSVFKMAVWSEFTGPFFLTLINCFFPWMIEDFDWKSETFWKFDRQYYIFTCLDELLVAISDSATLFIDFVLSRLLHISYSSLSFALPHR